MTIGDAQTKLTEALKTDDLEALAQRIEGNAIPLSVLELSQLCAVLGRRLAALTDPASVEAGRLFSQAENGQGR